MKENRSQKNTIFRPLELSEEFVKARVEHWSVDIDFRLKPTSTTDFEDVCDVGRPTI